MTLLICQEEIVNETVVNETVVNKKINRLSLCFQCLLACFTCPMCMGCYDFIPEYSDVIPGDSDCCTCVFCCYTNVGFIFAKDNKLYNLLGLCIVLDYFKNVIGTLIWWLTIIILFPIFPALAVVLILLFIMIICCYFIYIIIVPSFAIECIMKKISLAKKEGTEEEDIKEEDTIKKENKTDELPV